MKLKSFWSIQQISYCLFYHSLELETHFLFYKILRAALDRAKTLEQQLSSFYLKCWECSLKEQLGKFFPRKINRSTFRDYHFNVSKTELARFLVTATQKGNIGENCRRKTVQFMYNRNSAFF